MDDFWEFMGIILVICLIVILVFAGVAAAFQFSNKLYCDQVKAIMPDQTFRYNFWTGCLIRLPDGTYSGAADYLNEGRFNLKVDNTNK